MATLRFNLEKHFDDPRAMPTYGIPQAARYLRLPEATLRSWVRGRSYPTARGTRRFKPVLALPDPEHPLLSFFNLAEAHVLRAIRAEHHVRLHHIRLALDYLNRKFGSAHPLVEHSFRADGARLFVAELERLVDVSALGQLVFPHVMSHLERLEFDDGLVGRFYPFTRARDQGPKTVLIDPRFAFGRPVLARSRVPTEAILERYRAGESVDDLAKDYGCPRLEIEEAIRCEIYADAA